MQKSGLNVGYDRVHGGTDRALMHRGKLLD